MLLKIERTILRKVSKQPHENQIDVSCFGKYPKEAIYCAFIELKNKGYFELVEASIDYSNFSYVLTTKGRYYKEYVFKTFLRNVLIPFIVALLTTIATLYLEKLIENDNSTNNSCYTCEYRNDN